MDLSFQFNVALEAIKKASEIIVNVYHSDFSYRLKSDQSVVTQADIQSENIIRKTLLDNFPTYGFLGEETKDDVSRLNKEFCWIVDPLDGTKDFVNRTDEFSINIALSYKQKIVLGLIAIPLKNIVYYAILNNGAYRLDLNNQKITPIHVNQKTENIHLLVSNFFFEEDTIHLLQKQNLISTYTHCGSSYKACKIAEGLAEVNIKFDDKTKEWDTAPSEIIIKEAGGYMSDMYGKEKLYNKADVVNRTGYIIANHPLVLKKFIQK